MMGCHSPCHNCKKKQKKKQKKTKQHNYMTGKLCLKFWDIFITFGMVCGKLRVYSTNTQQEYCTTFIYFDIVKDAVHKPL